MYSFSDETTLPGLQKAFSISNFLEVVFFKWCLLYWFSVLDIWTFLTSVFLSFSLETRLEDENDIYQIPILLRFWMWMRFYWLEAVVWDPGDEVAGIFLKQWAWVSVPERWVLAVARYCTDTWLHDSRGFLTLGRSNGGLTSKPTVGQPLAPSVVS